MGVFERQAELVFGDPSARFYYSDGFGKEKASSQLFCAASKSGLGLEPYNLGTVLNHPVTLGWLQLSSNFFWIKFSRERSCLIFWLSFAQEVKANCNEGLTAGEPPNKWEAYIDWQPACQSGDKCIFIHGRSRALSAPIECCLSDHARHIWILSNCIGWCKTVLL